MAKIVTILGCRPEIIRLSLIIPLLDKNFKHTLIHTGQNQDPLLKDIFFNELNIRQPDISLDISNNAWYGRMSKLMLQCGSWLREIEPDKVLILGDTDSALSSLLAKRMDIPVYHMEAGNRCRDDRSPEEANRKCIDQCSEILMPYTERSRQNLLLEGFKENKIFVIGNPITEVLDQYHYRIKQSDILEQLHLEKNKYVLVTVHRAENVDYKRNLNGIFEGLTLCQRYINMPFIISTHPRTEQALSSNPISNNNLTFGKPFGFLDFLKLQMNALCVITDSGTVQEECAINHVRNITIRRTTERPETVECGSNIVCGDEPESILRGFKVALNSSTAWISPYPLTMTSETVIKIIGGV
jgi:UDP-N-acetylglucosamine 2-epimerase (non-hydrolysing)